MKRRTSPRQQKLDTPLSAGGDRESGVAAIGPIPWGTHASLFYETKTDLTDILIPFFKTGLDNNECGFCVVSDPLDEATAATAFRNAIPEIEQYLSDGSFDIVAGSKVYLQDGRFKPERVIDAWEAKLTAALAKGYAGLRATGNESWLTPEYWNEFASYEIELEKWISGKPVIVLCTYPLAKASGAHLLDIARIHDVLIAKRDGQWETLETPELKQAKEQLAKINNELEARVKERTQKLAATNAKLVTEIAERTHAEKVVRQSHELLHLVVETLPVGVVLVDRNGDISLINEASKRIWAGAIIDGRERWDQTKGYWHSSGQRIDPEDWASARALAKGETSLNELIDIESYDGLRKIIRNSAAPIYDASGKIAGAVVVNEDVTDRIRAEEALRQSEDELRRVIDTIPVNAWTIRPDGVTDFLNRHSLEYSGLSLSQYLRDSNATVHPDDLPRVLERWASQFARGEAYDGEMRLRRADGQYRWFLVRTAPLRDNAGHVVKWYGVATDIEDRRAAEEALRKANDRLRNLSRRRIQIQEEERRHLARELHDQIGQLLTAAKISMQSSQRLSADSTLNSKLADTVGILDSVLEQTRKISFALRPPVLDDLGLAPALRSMLSDTAGSAGLGADFFASPDLQRADAESETACYRVAVEAVRNSITHAGAHKITIEVRNLDGNIELRVRDDGRGFDVEKIERAAERDRLGLAGMRDRTLEVGGRFEIRSEPGKGTEIIALFPIAAAPDVVS